MDLWLLAEYPNGQGVCMLQRDFPPPPPLRRRIAAINQDVWKMLREIDSGNAIRSFIHHVSPNQPETLLPEQAEAILATLDLPTYTRARGKLTEVYHHDSTLAHLRDRWEDEEEDETDQRIVISMMVNLFAALTPCAQLNDRIHANGAIVGIREGALDMLDSHAWTGFNQARDIVADLVVYATSTRFYIIEPRDVTRALALRAIR